MWNGFYIHDVLYARSFIPSSGLFARKWCVCVAFDWYFVRQYVSMYYGSDTGIYGYLHGNAVLPFQGPNSPCVGAHVLPLIPYVFSVR